GMGLAMSVLIGLVIAWTGLGLAYFTNDPPGFFVTTIAIVIFAIARAAHSLGRRGRAGAPARGGGGRGRPAPGRGGGGWGGRGGAATRCWRGRASQWPAV